MKTETTTPGGAAHDEKAISGRSVAPIRKKRTRRETAPGKPRGRDLQSQLEKGREFMKKYADTFRALAK